MSLAKEILDHPIKVQARNSAHKRNGHQPVQETWLLALLSADANDIIPSNIHIQYWLYQLTYYAHMHGITIQSMIVS